MVNSYSQFSGECVTNLDWSAFHVLDLSIESFIFHFNILIDLIKLAKTASVNKASIESMMGDKIV